MTFLVTGGAGYLGSVLIPRLLMRKHNVRILDIGYFGMGHFQSYQPSVEIIREDLRQIVQNDSSLDQLLDGVDGIIHLAAISNDPSAELYPELTEEVNVTATRILAQKAQERGIRFIFSSSCSIYGKHDGLADENSSVQPVSIYAKSKVRCEEILDEISDPSWPYVILRNVSAIQNGFKIIINIIHAREIRFYKRNVFLYFCIRSRHIQAITPWLVTLCGHRN